MDIGRKIYYGKSNGVIIWDKGESTGSVRQTTLEEDIKSMPILGMIDSKELGFLQLEYGQYRLEFQNCIAVKIDINTGLPKFLFTEK